MGAGSVKRSYIVGGVVVAICVVAGGGYFYSNYAEEKVKEEIAKAEQKIKSLFKGLGPEFDEGETSLSYKVAGTGLSGKVDLENVVIKNTPNLESERRSISISKLLLSNIGDLLNIENAENFKAYTGRGGYIGFGHLRIKGIPIIKINEAVEANPDKIVEALKIITFSDFRIENLKIKEEKKSPEQYIASFSIGKLENNTLTDVTLKNLNFQERENKPKISVESVSLDKFVLPLVLEDEEKITRNVSDAFGLSALKVEKITFSEKESGVVQLGSLQLDVGRHNELINDVNLKLTAAEIPKSALLESGFIPEEILDTVNQNKLIFNASMSSVSDFSASTSSIEISANLEQLAKVGLNLTLGGISEDLIKKLGGSPDSGLLNEITKDITFKTIGFSFSNEGLTEIAFKLAEKENGLNRQQISEIVGVSIESNKNLDASQKAKIKTAIQTFIKSGQSLKLSINSKNPSGLTTDTILMSFLTGSLGDVLEFDVAAQ
jgi:hypothetical protein